MDEPAGPKRVRQRTEFRIGSTAVGPAAAEEPLPRLSVAVVLEAEVWRKRVAAALERGGLEVAVEVSVSEELAALDGGRVDVVILACDRLSLDDVAPLRLIRELLPGSPIVLVAFSATRRAIREMLAEGMDGLVLERNLDEALALAVQSVCAGQVTLPSEVREHVSRPVLSPREKQILAMVVMGFTNAEIAQKLHLAESTVKSHLSSAFAKLGVRSRNEATALILDKEHGLGAGILAITEDEHRGTGS